MLGSHAAHEGGFLAWGTASLSLHLLLAGAGRAGGAPSRQQRLLPLGSSACLASLRSAAAKLEDGAAWADSALLVAGLPLGTRAPLSGEGVRGLTVAVVLVAVESIPSEGDLGSWLMPETGKEEPGSPREQRPAAEGPRAACRERRGRPWHRRE